MRSPISGWKAASRALSDQARLCSTSSFGKPVELLERQPGETRAGDRLTEVGSALREFGEDWEDSLLREPSVPPR